jgi:hypothetical protein
LTEEGDKMGHIKITVEEFAGGFAINVDEEGTDNGARYYFDQEEAVGPGLCDLFQDLGFTVEYEADE